MTEARRELVKTIADYIISTGCSVRATAIVFKLSKTTVSKYMQEIETVDPIRFKKVRAIVNSNNDNIIHESDIIRINKVTTLYLKGHTFEQIAEITGYSYSQIQRDISSRLRLLDEKEYEKTQEIKGKNIRNNSSFESKKYLIRTKEELDLYLKGLTQEQIAFMLQIGQATVSRDLNSLSDVDTEKYEQIKIISDNNKTKTKIRRR